MQLKVISLFKEEKQEKQIRSEAAHITKTLNKNKYTNCKESKNTIKHKIKNISQQLNYRKST